MAQLDMCPRRGERSCARGRLMRHARRLTLDGVPNSRWRKPYGRTRDPQSFRRAPLDYRLTQRVTALETDDGSPQRCAGHPASPCRVVAMSWEPMHRMSAKTPHLMNISNIRVIFLCEYSMEKHGLPKTGQNPVQLRVKGSMACQTGGRGCGGAQGR